MRRLIGYTATILLTLSVLVILWQLRQAIVLFVLSLAVAAAFRPLINFLDRFLPRGLALALSYVLVITVFGLTIFSIGGPLIRDIQQATDDFSAYYQRITTEWPQSASLFQSTIGNQLPAPERLFEALTGERGAAIAQAVVGVASGFFELLSSIVIILILSLYWSVDRVHFERLWLSLLPVGYRTRAREVWREVEMGVGAYISSEAVQSLLAGSLLWLGFRSMGLEYPALLAVLGALAWLVPWVGAVIAVIPALLVGLGISSGVGALAAIYTLMVLFVMEVVVEPRFFHRQKYSSLLLVLIVIAFALAFGLAGVILAPPFAAALQIFFSHYTRTRNLPHERMGQITFNEEAVQQLEILKARVAKIQETLAREGDDGAPERVNLIKRLDQLIKETDQFLETSR